MQTHQKEEPLTRTEDMSYCMEPGWVVSMSEEEASSMGAFLEDALSVEDAEESNGD